MQHIHQLTDARLEQPSIVAVGIFDGVHRGHQYLIRRLVEAARASHRTAIVLTFFPHPDVVIRGISAPYYLTSPEARARLLGELGVDLVITHPFNDQIRHIRAADFVDQLCTYLKLSALWATKDFALGYQREGNIDFLREQGRLKGFTVETLELLAEESSGEVITSAAIRTALREGDVNKIGHFLGRFYEVGGEVIHGEKRGRKIGFPTANINYWSQQLLPQFGVYAGWAHLGPEIFMAVTNIGQRPTFDGQTVTVEAHLLDFGRDIYGQYLALDFVQRLRGEVKFSGIDALVAQIRHDVAQGREILQASKP